MYTLFALPLMASYFCTQPKISEIAHRLLVLSLRTNQLFDVDGLIVEEHFGKVIHVVVELWLDEIVGEHRMMQTGGYRHTEEDFVYAFRKWLVNMVVCWVRPDVTNQSIMVFVGE